MKGLDDKKILESWRKNVSPWVDTIQNKQIESRVQVTDQAIIETVTSLSTNDSSGNRVLDVGCGEGWRKGSWEGFSHDFCDPAPWYFRTIESWIQLFINSGFVLTEFKEPINSRAGKPASLILAGSA